MQFLRSASARFLLSLCTALLLLACGRESARSGEVPAASTSAAAVCSFVSPGDLQALVGAPLEQTKHSAYGSVEECTFETPATETIPRVVTIRVEAIANANSTYQQMRELFSDDELTVGGHRALIAGSSQIIVVTPEKQVLTTLGMPGTPAGDRRETLIKVAELIVSRMP